jgi:osmotically-inducible protein OsmY
MPHSSVAVSSRIVKSRLQSLLPFFGTATIPQETVRLSVREGYVTLEGRLDSCRQKEFLEAIIQHVPGVKGVTNLIKIGF